MKRCRSCGTAWDSQEGRCPFCRGLNVDRSYTPSPREDELRDEVRKRLEPFTGPLIEELRTILAAPKPAGTHTIDFEVHSDEFRDTFGIRWDPMDAENDQLDGGHPLLKDSGPLIPRDLFDLFDHFGIDIPDTAYRVLLDWFRDVWITAGGSDCAYASRLGHHDAGISFDLKTGEWDRGYEI